LAQSKPALGIRSNVGRCGHHNGPNANGPNSLSKGAGAGPACMHPCAPGSIGGAVPSWARIALAGEGGVACA
jgi:hypothetical protein